MAVPAVRETLVTASELLDTQDDTAEMLRRFVRTFERRRGYADAEDLVRRASQGVNPRPVLGLRGPPQPLATMLESVNAAEAALQRASKAESDAAKELRDAVSADAAELAAERERLEGLFAGERSRLESAFLDDVAELYRAHGLEVREDAELFTRLVDPAVFAAKFPAPVSAPSTAPGADPEGAKDM